MPAQEKATIREDVANRGGTTSLTPLVPYRGERFCFSRSGVWSGIDRSPDVSTVTQDVSEGKQMARGTAKFTHNQYNDRFGRTTFFISSSSTVLVRGTSSKRGGSAGCSQGTRPIL